MTPYPSPLIKQHGARFIDLSGRRFGRLVALHPSHLERTKYYYFCKCDCGNETVARGEHLKQGRTVSCGCKKIENAADLGQANEQHGASSSGGTRRPPLTYLTWKSMKERCFYPKHKSYGRYGGRGITICDLWLNGDGVKTGYECFLRDMGPRPSERHSIDRFPDNDGDYEPGNCRWATSLEQHWTQRKGALVDGK